MEDKDKDKDKETEEEKETETETKKTPPVDPPAKSFSQEEVNAINAKTKDKFLKSLGFESEEAYKTHLADKEAKKPLEEKLKAQETSANENLSRAETAEAKLKAIELGVPSAKLAKVIKLAKTYDGDTIDVKIAEALKEFPEFKTNTVPPFGNPPSGDKGGDSQEEKLKKLFKAELTRH